MAIVVLLCGAAGFVGLAVRALHRGRAGRPEAIRQVPWLFLIAFILLVFGALVWAAYVVLHAGGRL